jgi:hypothetical protein
MVVIPVVGEHLHDQWRMTQATENCRGEQSAIETVCDSLPEDARGRPISMFRAIGELIEERLDLSRSG